MITFCRATMSNVQSNNNAGNDAPRRASELRHRISFLAASHAMLDEIDTTPFRHPER